jgi:hypothetical protein
MNDQNDENEMDFNRPILKSPKAVKPEVDDPKTPRLFLREPGWKVALKVGSDRLFCYMTIPGEKYYHRIMDGEIHLTRDDEKICLPCAERRGLLAFSPRPLRDPEPAIQFLLDQLGNDELMVALTWDDSEESGTESTD